MDDARTVFGVKQYRNWANAPIAEVRSQVVFGLGFARAIRPQRSRQGAVLYPALRHFIGTVSSQLGAELYRILPHRGLHTIRESRLPEHGPGHVSSAPGAGSLRLTGSISGTVPLSQTREGVSTSRARELHRPDGRDRRGSVGEQCGTVKRERACNVKAGRRFGGEGTVTGDDYRARGMLAPGGRTAPPQHPPFCRRAQPAGWWGVQMTGVGGFGQSPHFRWDIHQPG